MYGQEGQGGRDGLNGKIGVDTHALLILRVKWVTNENILHSSRKSTRCSVVT